MYCNKCGHEIQDGQQFCPKCGEGMVQKETLICTQCGTPIESDAKFCNVCGTPVKAGGTTKAFCTCCGAHLKDGERFCPSCGKAASGAVFETGAKKAPLLKGDVISTNLLKRLCTPIGIKHTILAGVLVLLLVLICLPTFQFKSVYASWFNTEYSYTTPVANPLFGSAEVAEMMDYADAEARTAYNIVSFVIYSLDFIFLALAIWVTVKPILFNTLTKHRGFIYQTLVAIFWLIATLFWWLYFAVLGASEEGVKISITISGVLVLVLCVVVIILCRIIAYDNRVLRENGYATV